MNWTRRGAYIIDADTGEYIAQVFNAHTQRGERRAEMIANLPELLETFEELRKSDATRND